MRSIHTGLAPESPRRWPGAEGLWTGDGRHHGGRGEGRAVLGRIHAKFPTSNERSHGCTLGVVGPDSVG